MEIVGKNYTTKKNGERVSTLQVLQPYEAVSYTHLTLPTNREV